jgi:oxygen-dependent protoporphyrinogen oxidase
MALIPNSSPAAKNRFIYYPDRLNQLPLDVPSALLSFRLPVMKGVFSGVIREPFQRQRPPDLQDESVASFFSRRCNAKIAQNMVSAVLHGIYAGDIDRLSIKTLFPKLWKAEADHGSLIVSFLGKKSMDVLSEKLLESEIRPGIRELLAKIDDTNVYSFKDGIETLSRALEAELHESPNVTIRTSTEISNLKYSPQDPEFPFGIPGTAKKYSHVISTLFAPDTNSLLPEKLRIPALAQIEAVTVLIVNLYFDSPNLLPVEGFGYLLPKSLSESENPDKALGVIFDSHSTPQPSEKGTKLTVMFGGHYWNGRTSYPSYWEAVEMARDVLRNHLAIDQVPIATNVALNKNCIPQPNVGHDERIKNIKSALLENFSGRLAVAGSSYRGVGLNDCVRSARDVVTGMLKEGKCTGLEGLGDEMVWIDTTPRK